jgi:hypothetical protein
VQHAIDPTGAVMNALGQREHRAFVGEITGFDLGTEGGECGEFAPVVPHRDHPGASCDQRLGCG